MTVNWILKVTDDQCPGTGDDTDHEKLEYFNQVPCFSTDIINNKSENEEPEVIDVVFLSLWVDQYR